MCVVPQTQRQLQLSLEAHGRYIASLMEQEGLGHRLQDIAGITAPGPAPTRGCGTGGGSGPATEAGVSGAAGSKAVLPSCSNNPADHPAAQREQEQQRQQQQPDATAGTAGGAVAEDEPHGPGGGPVSKRQRLGDC